MGWMLWEQEQKRGHTHAQAHSPVRGAGETQGYQNPSAAAFLKGGMWPRPRKQSLHKRESNLQCPVIC